MLPFAPPLCSVLLLIHVLLLHVLQAQKHIAITLALNSQCKEIKKIFKVFYVSHIYFPFLALFFVYCRCMFLSVFPFGLKNFLDQFLLCSSAGDKFLWLCLPDVCLFCLHFWKTVLLDIEFSVNSVFSQSFNDFIPLSSGLHWF